LRLLDPFGTGKVVISQVTYDRDWHAYELVFFVLLGAIGGIYSSLNPTTTGAVVFVLQDELFW